MERVENFFLIGCQIEEIEIKELLLRRYHTLDFIKTMGVDEFCEFLSLAIEKENKEKVERQYLALLPLLCLRGKYMSFDEFYNTFTGKNIDWRSADEIIAEIDALHERVNNGS